MSERTSERAGGQRGIRRGGGRRSKSQGRDNLLGWGLLLALTLAFGGLSTFFTTVGQLLSPLGQLGPAASAVSVIVLGAALVVGLPLYLRGRRAARTDQAEAHRSWLAQVRTLDGLLALSPTQFELAVGDCLRAQGYREMRHTGGAGDLAADLTCRAPDGRTTVVQCKRYAPQHAVGSPEIQQFLGMMTIHHRAQLGIFVTTSSFTQPARALAQQHQPYLALVDGTQLASMLQAIA